MGSYKALDLNMDILDLDASLKVLNHNGVCFNVEERLQL